MIQKILSQTIIIILSTFSFISCVGEEILFCGSTHNDVYELLVDEGLKLKNFSSPDELIKKASVGASAIIVADSYPFESLDIATESFKLIKEKQLRIYIEYINRIPGLQIEEKPFHGKLERGVATNSIVGLDSLSLFTVNDCYVFDSEVKSPLLVLAKVAGFDEADFGLDNTKVYPLLAFEENILIGFSKLSNFRTGRYAPNSQWKKIWTYILSYVTNNNNFAFKSNWPTDLSPMYGRTETLKEEAKKEMVKKGVDWFYRGRFLIDPSWKEEQLKNQGDGLMPVASSLGKDKKVGDGSMGILEGHASNIYYNGDQDYRYWLRADIQGEVAMALAAASDLLGDNKYQSTAKNIMKYVLKDSQYRAEERNDPQSAVYGLIGWSDTHPYVFYTDDNARLLLGLIGASSYTEDNLWHKEIVEGILANFRITNVNGFFAPGGRLEQPDILKNGLKYYQDRPNFKNPHPHFESWIWACYLWLYQRTGYEPLLLKTKKAIQLTMEAYPDHWLWTNGIQQERARMILPLAWLVRVEDTPQHRKWLDDVAQKLLENQVECGAIREELGDSQSGVFGRTMSNADYGVTEAPLISKNGDSVADMLYTSNFAFFTLNEAAKATGNPLYAEAVNKLSDFLTRIQVQSSKHEHLDGAWFRAFCYDNWEYWASNSDAGWGAWSTLTGWIQSWIVTTQVLIEQDTSFWDKSLNLDIAKEMKELEWMLSDKQIKTIALSELK